LARDKFFKKETCYTQEIFDLTHENEDWENLPPIIKNRRYNTADKYGMTGYKYWYEHKLKSYTDDGIFNNPNYNQFGHYISNEYSERYN
jgi:hypothetical protein